MLYTAIIVLVVLFLIGVLQYNQKHKQHSPVGESLMKKCVEVMTQDLVYCLPNDTVAKAAELMKKPLP